MRKNDFDRNENLRLIQLIELTCGIAFLQRTCFMFHNNLCFGVKKWGYDFQGIEIIGFPIMED